VAEAIHNYFDYKAGRLVRRIRVYKALQQAHVRVVPTV